MNPAILWAVLTLILFIAEIATVNLVTIWFAVAAFISFLLAVGGVSVQVQLISFILTSIILLALSYPFIKSRFNKSYSRTNYDRVIGEDALVIKDINEIEGSGTVKVIGQTWSARSADKSTITEGKLVEVLEVKGASLIVKEIKENK